MFIRICLFAIILSSINSCTPKMGAHFLSLNEVENRVAQSKDKNKKICSNKLNYAPSLKYPNHTPTKTIRLNFHLMNSTSREYNFDEVNGKWYAENLVTYMTNNIKENKKMWLPVGNNTPVLPLKYRYKIQAKPGNPSDDGIYFHYDDELFYYTAHGKGKNNYSRDVIRKYAINDDKVLNVFIMPDHPDTIKYKKKSSQGTGIALGTSVKLCHNKEKAGGSPWEQRGLANHEIGHILGLSHTWSGSDGCDDTPKHSNCYNKSISEKCKDATSNNMMDYNAHQIALTPCQIGSIHYRFATLGSRQRKLLVENWCRLNPEKHIYIRDKVDWDCSKDLEGHLTIEPGGNLTMRCRISLPKNAKITVKAGATLVLDNCKLHNACGDQWKGIQIEGEGENKGNVIFIGEPLLEDMQHPVE